MTSPYMSVVIPSLEEDQKKLCVMIDRIVSDRSVLEVIVVDDYSSAPLCLPNAKVVRNSSRLGSSKSREIGIAQASGSVILTTDAHVRFKSADWGSKIVEAVTSEPQNVFCPVCIPSGNCSFRGKLYGGNIDVMTTRNGRAAILETNWNESLSKDGIIGCVMGGAYAFSSAWHRKIGGYGGIKGWCPTEMAAISLKTRLAGGSCIVLGVEMEHEFRTKPPFQFSKTQTVYNKLRLASVIFPPGIATMVPTLLSGTDGLMDALYENMADFKDIVAERDRFWRECESNPKEAAAMAGIEFEIDKLVRKTAG